MNKLMIFFNMLGIQETLLSMKWASVGFVFRVPQFERLKRSQSAVRLQISSSGAPGKPVPRDAVPRYVMYVDIVPMFQTLELRVPWCLKDSFNFLLHFQVPPDLYPVCPPSLLLRVAHCARTWCNTVTLESVLMQAHTCSMLCQNSSELSCTQLICCTCYELNSSLILPTSIYFLMLR